jgi:hypothetical protein
LCPHCLQVPETTAHLWQCLCAQSAIGELAAGGYVLFWKLVATAQSSPQITQATIFPGPHSITDVIQGIVPLEWVSMMHRAGLTMDKAQSIASRVGAYFVTTAKAQIWNPQCDAQAAQEHSLQVTCRDKIQGRRHMSQPSPRNASSQQYITNAVCARAGWCPRCHVSIVDHHGGVCPPEILQAPFLADELLCSHYMSQCLLPSVYNPCVVLKVLDSTESSVEEP